MKVLIDTNNLIASIPPKNPEYWLYEYFENQLFTWVISNEILSEYIEKLTEFYSKETANLVINILLSAPNIEFHEAYFRWNLIDEDPDDNKFVDVGLASNADFLVTQDRHFKSNRISKITDSEIGRI
jgi:uncharacterized protein